VRERQLLKRLLVCIVATFILSAAFPLIIFKAGLAVAILIMVLILSQSKGAKDNENG
jgi:hypothetical protein